MHHFSSKNLICASALLSQLTLGALSLCPLMSACDSATEPSPTAAIEAGVELGGSACASYDEPVWVEETSDPTQGVMMSVWGDGERVWAVGGQPSEGKLWSREASALAGEGEWQLNETPEGPLLNWVHGAEGHVWIVGNDGRALRSVEGSAWEPFETGTTQDLWGVFVVSPNEVWAVGGDANGDGEANPVLAKFNGDSWSLLPVPELDRSGVRALFKVWSDGEGRVWAVGMKGVIIGDMGEGWAQQLVSPAEGAPPNSEDLVSLWGANGEVVAVGGRSNGVVARWDGEAWRSQTIAGLPGLNGVWVNSCGVASAVGVRGSAVTISLGSFEGSFEVTRERTNSTMVLHALWSDGAQRWTVGGTLDSAPPWEGVVLVD